LQGRFVPIDHCKGVELNNYLLHAMHGIYMVMGRKYQ
jgi:hypothetical protein